jgi:hypothetical protein
MKEPVSSTTFSDVAYTARRKNAEKTVNNISPEVKEKISQYYPKVTKESIANKALSPKGTQSGHAVTDNNNHTRTVK